MADSEEILPSLQWADLSRETKEFLKGKLAGLWGAETDEAAFDSWTPDKKYALLLLLKRMRAKELWHVVKRIDNVYGEGGVGLQFEAWPIIESTLSREMISHADLRTITIPAEVSTKRVDRKQYFTSCFRKDSHESGTCISIYTVRFTHWEASGNICDTSS